MSSSPTPCAIFLGASVNKRSGQLFRDGGVLVYFCYLLKDVFHIMTMPLDCRKGRCCGSINTDFDSCTAFWRMIFPLLKFSMQKIILTNRGCQNINNFIKGEYEKFIIQSYYIFTYLLSSVMNTTSVITTRCRCYLLMVNCRNLSSALCM